MQVILNDLMHQAPERYYNNIKTKHAGTELVEYDVINSGCRCLELSLKNSMTALNYFIQPIPVPPYSDKSFHQKQFSQHRYQTVNS